MEFQNGHHTALIDKGNKRPQHNITYRVTSESEMEVFGLVDEFIRPYAEQKVGLIKLLKQGLDTAALVTEIEEKTSEIEGLKTAHAAEIAKLNQQIESLKLQNALGTTEGGDIKSVVEQQTLNGIQQFKQQWEHEQTVKELGDLKGVRDKLEDKLERKEEELRAKNKELEKANSWNRKLDSLPAALKVTFGHKPNLHKQVVGTVDAFLTGDTSTLDALPIGQSVQEINAVIELMQPMEDRFKKLMQNMAYLIVQYPQYRQDIEQLMHELVAKAQAQSNQTNETE